jgi:hypothetical protein
VTEQRELERAIDEARVVGDADRVRELQARYLEAGFAVERVYVGRDAIRLHERAATSARSAAPVPPRPSQRIPLRVVLAPEVMRALVDADWRTDLERGAWLYGHIEGDELVCEIASGWREGTRDSVRLDGESLLARGQVSRVAVLRISSQSPAATWLGTTGVHRR